ncbi:MAG: site-specific integrase [Planctomycetaceae bacterium]
MGSVFRKQTTRKPPLDAEFFTRKGEQFARWRDGRGKARTARVTCGRDSSKRIVTSAGTFTAKYWDGQGIVREVATGCRDKQAAMSVLADLERRAELVKAQVLTPTHDAVADHQTRPLADHFEDYAAYLEVRECSSVRITNMRSQFSRVCADCGFQRLSDLDAERLTKWLLGRQREGMSPATRNGYRETFVMFANWCCDGVRPRMLKSPFDSVPRGDVKADRRRQRRAMTESELENLLTVAALRPLAEYGRLTTRKRPDESAGRSTWHKAPLSLKTIHESAERARERLKGNPDLIDELVWRGRERALVYKTLVLTGLRRNELASLNVGQCLLDGTMPCLELDAADEKNRHGSLLPLRSDLAAELGEWIARKAQTAEKAVGESPTIPFKVGVIEGDEGGSGDPVRRDGRLKPELNSAPLFDVPSGLVKILDRDLKVAGIPKRDDRGRSLDVHALRHTFGTLLSKGGVTPRTAQAAMRHSHIDLTMNVYTDPKLLDVQGALDVLPSLNLDSTAIPEQWPMRATGTTDLVAPTVAPNLVQPSTQESLSVIRSIEDGPNSRSHRHSAKSYSGNRKGPLSTQDNGPSQVGTTAAALNHGQRCGTRM